MKCPNGTLVQWHDLRIILAPYLDQVVLRGVGRRRMKTQNLKTFLPYFNTPRRVLHKRGRGEGGHTPHTHTHTICTYETFSHLFSEVLQMKINAHTHTHTSSFFKLKKNCLYFDINIQFSGKCFYKLLLAQYTQPVIKTD